MIEVNNLSKSYGDRLAVSRLNFRVNKGEVVGFLGPNGAGKTTTMKIITGYMAPSSGTVKVAGHDVFEDPLEVKRRIGYLPEVPPVYGDMRVEDFLTYAANLRRAPKERIQSLVQSAIEKTNLGDVRKRLIGNLSKGFRQRVGLAQALVSDPEILILDEPTVGLDPKQVAEMRQLIQQLRGQHTIVLSTHILPEVQASCERVIIINRGQIVAEDTLDHLAVRMSAGRRLHVRVRKTGMDFSKLFTGVKGVLKVEAEVAGCVVDTDQNDETVELVAKKIIESGAGLLELRTQTMDLEDIFIKLTSNEGVQTV